MLNWYQNFKKIVLSSQNKKQNGCFVRYVCNYPHACLHKKIITNQWQKNKTLRNISPYFRLMMPTFWAESWLARAAFISPAWYASLVALCMVPIKEWQIGTCAPITWSKHESCDCDRNMINIITNITKYHQEVINTKNNEANWHLKTSTFIIQTKNSTIETKNSEYLWNHVT